MKLGQGFVILVCPTCKLTKCSFNVSESRQKPQRLMNNSPVSSLPPPESPLLSPVSEVLSLTFS